MLRTIVLRKFCIRELSCDRQPWTSIGFLDHDSIDHDCKKFRNVPIKDDDDDYDDDDDDDDDNDDDDEVVQEHVVHLV